MPVGAGTCAGADCQLVDQSLPAQLTKLAKQLDRHRQPADHPAEGRLSARIVASSSVSGGQHGHFRQEQGCLDMETFHNPDRFMSDLRQVLSQGRKRIGLLVGAGAPLAIKVDAENVLDPGGKPLIPGVEDLTKLAMEGLDATQAEAIDAIRTNLGRDANIESILSRVRLMQQALGTAKVSGLDADGYKALGSAICERIGKAVAPKLPKSQNAYTELVAWISGTMRTHAVEVFTTNYDLLFEDAFERARNPYFDGFSGGSAPFF